ncbi:kinase-like domain-containing protein [Rhizophagus clarus]|uniref:Kinase-like domain-containing protein n=1 Tax=Rhizophagus clarus TaxID=94130 RepID=A0A8H3KS81_9GLOM|nr:kinase-like domain-containing protein [Rhizophagus clarus]
MSHLKFINTIYENSFDPTPKLKSSPIPISFISFNRFQNDCSHCGNKYSLTVLFNQKYCELCLLRYIENTGDTYLDMHMSTDNTMLNKYGTSRNRNFCAQNIKERFANCSKIFYFKQIFSYHYLYEERNVKESKDCKLCGKLFPKQKSSFKICSDCYQVSCGWIKSTFTEEFIPILCLPWVELNWRTYNTFVKNFNSFEIYDAFFKYKNGHDCCKTPIKWIPYSRIENLEKIAEGGFSDIYKALWRHFNCVEESYKKTVVIKKFLNLRVMNKYFLNELKSYYNYINQSNHIIGCYGITQNPETRECILIIIHERNFIHRDFHSGNILLVDIPGKIQRWAIGDLGLSRSANNPLLNNEIYGVIPYIAPEIFRGAIFSKESDIYSFGMIIWELTTGCKPFSDIEHDIGLIYEIIDGGRPEITNDTPECFAKLIKSCWNSNPAERPSALEIAKALSSMKAKNALEFKHAEEKRLDLIKLKKLGPEFTGKSHSESIYTSGSRISNSLSNNLIFSTNLNTKHKYVTREYDFDINMQSKQRLSLSSTHSAIQEFPRKHHIEELMIGIQNDGKRIKV